MIPIPPMPSLAPSSANFGLPQTRARVYFVLVRADVATQERVELVFGTFLQKLLEAFPARGRVSTVRDYVAEVCASMGWVKTMPPFSQDGIAQQRS